MVIEQKSAIHLILGWQTLWSEDNWVKSEWFNLKGINLDWAGYSTDQALKEVLRYE